MRYEGLTVWQWFRDVVLNILPPYSFGFGSGQAEIQLRLYKGGAGLRLLFPWLNTPVKSRDLALHPGDTREFYHQLDFAFRKWKKKMAVRARKRSEPGPDASAQTVQAPAAP